MQLKKKIFTVRLLLFFYFLKATNSVIVPLEGSRPHCCDSLFVLRQEPNLSTGSPGDPSPAPQRHDVLPEPGPVRDERPGAAAAVGGIPRYFSLTVTKEVLSQFN